MAKIKVRPRNTGQSLKTWRLGLGLLSIRSKKRFNETDASLAWPSSHFSYSPGWGCIHPGHKTKGHFERLKPHNSGPLEFAATPLDTGDIAVVMDPKPERSVEPIDDDCSKPSYHSEQLLSEASDVSLPSRQRHWMDTRLRTKLPAGGTRQHYQQFDYSTSETDDETVNLF